MPLCTVATPRKAAAWPTFSRITAMLKSPLELATTPSMAIDSAASLRGSRAAKGSRSLANLLSEEFENKIRQGLLQEGDKLPTETELVRSYDVSRTVVREALSKLQASGLVETKHGIGTFVLPARSTPGMVLSAHEPE